MLVFLISSAVAYLGYSQARTFVRERLKYVDAAQSPVAPVLAGGGAFATGAVVAALLPVIGPSTAIAFGISVGLGVLSGQRDIRRALPPGM